MSVTAAPSIENTIIRASAGSGKTRALSRRYLALIAGGIHCQSILATTFTRKAAGEILDRIMQELTLSSTNREAARALGDDLGLAAFDGSSARKLLRHLLSNLHLLQIGTLDSFFQMLARAYSLDIGLGHQWDIADERAKRRLIQTTLDQVLSHSDTNRLLQLMAKGESVRSANDVMLDTVDKLYQLYLNSAPDSWRQLPSIQVPDDAAFLAAIESVKNAPIESKGMSKARNDDLRRAEAEEWDAFLSTGLVPKLIDGTKLFNRAKIPEPVQLAYVPLIDYVRCVLTERLRQSTEATCELLQRFSDHYEQSKLLTGQLGFDDVTRRLMDLVAAVNQRGQEWGSFRLDWNVEHLLLDEFQDTDPDQWRVLEPFARRVTRPGKGRSFFCVGDVKQAIFGWRGGIAEIFDVVDEQFPDLHQQALTHSYRSAQPIIDAVNRVFENAGKYQPGNARISDAVQQWCGRFAHHTTAKTDLAGYAVLEVLPESEDWYAPVVERVRQIYEQARGSQIAVLTRTNDEVGELIFRLHSEHVPASEEGGNPLSDSAAVLLVVSLVQFADHPTDSIAWYHVSHSLLAPQYGIPRCGRDRKDSPETIRQAHQAAAMIRRELAADGYGATVARWALLLSPMCTQRELRRLQKLVELADQFDSQATLRPGDFAEFVRTEKVADPTGSPVRVMTVHKAKGLEFDAVILPCLSGGFGEKDPKVMAYRSSPAVPHSFVCRYVSESQRKLLPPMCEQAHQQQFQRRVSEDLCGLYVAMTRARHALCMLVRPKDKPHYQTPAGMLLATLPESEITGGIVYEVGDPEWYTRRTKSDDLTNDAPARKKHDAKKDAPPIRFAAAPTDTLARASGVVAPSHMGHVSQRTMDGPFRPAGDAAAMDRGSLLHACFAQVKWLEDFPSIDVIRKELDRQFSHVANVDAVLGEFSRMVRQPGIAAILSRDRYLSDLLRQVTAGDILFEGVDVSVENERSFAYRFDSNIVAGAMDRLVIVREGMAPIAADVIDYKSDRVDPENDVEIQRLVESYRPQLEAYRRAAGRISGLPPSRISARIVLLGIDRVVEVR